MMSMTRMPFPCAALLVAFAALAPPGLAQEGTRFLVYFDEFSANLTQKSRDVIADAAKQAREANAQCDPDRGQGQRYRLDAGEPATLPRRAARSLPTSSPRTA